MMKIEETLSQDLKREFKVTVPAADIEKKLNDRLERMRKEVNVPGFRPGKVPLSLVIQRYKDEALSKVLEECISKGSGQVIKENNLKPALQPKVNLKSYEEGKELIFDVAMEILPTLGEMKLDGFSFEKYLVKIPSKTIAETLEALAKRNRKTRPLQKLRKTQKGDIVIIDFEGVSEGEPIAGGSGKNHALELGSNAFIPGFEEQLIGHEKGAQVEVKVTFPKDYHESRYANKPAHFAVTINDIHEADPVVVDAALAERLGFSSLEEMQKSVEKRLSKDYMGRSFLNTKRHVLDALAERFDFEVPQTMVDLEFTNIWNQLCKEIGVSQNTAANDTKVSSSKTFESVTGKEEETLKKEYRAIAERRVRLGILLAEIGSRHNITVTNQELSDALRARALEFPGQEREVFDFYVKSEAALQSLRAPLFEDKVVNLILDQSKITEKSMTPEELEKFLIHEEEEAEKKIASDAKTAKKPAAKVVTKKTKKKDS